MATGAKGPALAGSVSLDETRERDVLGHERAHLGCFSLTGIDAVPPRKITALDEKSPSLGLDTLYRGSLFS